MTSYKLLRSNKETGPYSLDDLVRVGLKPYDLVWVQGKSAAWRYPSEVEELKPYAPQVEEQPYDRFYKKNGQPVKEEPVLVQEQTYQPAVQAEQPAIEEKYAKYIPKKSVFVTMPGQQAAVAVQKPVTAEPKPVPEPTISVTENPAAAQIKYSQPLDEIKEMYVKTLQERKTKIARKSFMLSSLKKAAVIAGLILSGILAGYLIKSGAGSSKSSAAIQPVQQVATNQSAVAATPLQTPDQKPIADNNVVTPDQSLAATNTQKEEVATENTPIPPAMKERLLQQERKQIAENNLNKQPVEAPPVITEPQIKEQVPQVPARNVINDPVTGERTRQVRTGAPGNTSTDNQNTIDPKPLSRMPKTGLGKLVSVTSNDYKRVAFGGIRNLELTVTNDSRYVLDKVTVELEYLKPNEIPFRTETVQFHSVSPKGSSTIRIPDTNRGIKVTYKIVEIQSNQSEVAAGF